MKKITRIRTKVWQESGFAPFEVRAFSKFTLKVPYAIKLRRDRKHLINKAHKEKWTKEKLQQAIVWEYNSRGILKKGKHFTSKEAYALLRWFEKEWHDKAPIDDIRKWSSPSAKSSHHQGQLNHDRLLQQKRDYNAREDVKLKRANYRRLHRTEINEARRQLKLFKRNQLQ